MTEPTIWPEWPEVQAIERDSDADPEGFVLLHDYRYHWVHEGTHYRITVLKGFEYNEASAPRVIWLLISPLDLGPGTALVHDWLYHWQGLTPVGSVEMHRGRGAWIDTSKSYIKPGFFLMRPDWAGIPTRWPRKDVDRLFGRMMREAGVAKWRRRMAYRAVRLFGRGAWDKGKRT